MKDIATMFDKQEFEEIIENFKNSLKYEDLLYVLSSYISLNNVGGAYEFYKKREKILEKTDFLASMNYLLLILALLNNNELVKREFERIKSIPYISQEVEEFIHDLDENYKKIKATTEENSSTNYNFIEELNSENCDDVIGAIKYIHENFKDKINSYGVVFYEAFTKRENFDLAKNFLLLELLETGLDKDISFFKNGKFYYINPKEYQVQYLTYEKKIDEMIKFVKRNEKVTNLIDDISYYFISFLNNEIPTFFNNEQLETILYLAIRKAYMNISADINEDSIVKELKIDENLIKEYENSFNNF